LLAKKLSVAVLLVLALFLTGCGGRVVTDLYVQDIMETVEGLEQPLYTLSTITVESPGEEYNQQLIELLMQNFRDARNSRTTTEDYTSYVSVDVKVPILILEDYELLWENDEAIGIIVVDTEDGTAGFGLGLNSDKLDQLFAAFAEQIWDTASIEDFTFTIRLLNDAPGITFASLQGVYVNQDPVPYEEVFEMARRDVLEIRLGDVARDTAYQYGVVVVGVVE